VHDRQHYELVHHSRGNTELNYRRFFAVTTLAGVRVEDPEVFTGIHALVQEWPAAGVTGLRIDHPDGLVDPAEYLERLRAIAPDQWITVEKILEAGVVPRYLTAYCPSFRKESGAYGKDTRGIQRLHQFDKVELVKFVAPETSYDEHEKLRTDVQDVLEALGLPYRVLLLCAGDMSFAAAKCYDFETYAPGQQAWLEVSSCSNFESFQARRAGIRFRREAGAKPEFVHTLNASGLALPRIVITILEQNQEADGRVKIPSALVPLMGGREYLGSV